MSPQDAPETAPCCNLGITTLPSSTLALAVLTARAPCAACAAAASVGWETCGGSATAQLLDGGQRCGDPIRTLSSRQAASDAATEVRHTAGSAAGRLTAARMPSPAARPCRFVAPRSAVHGAPVMTSRGSGTAAHRGRPRHRPASMSASSPTWAPAWCCCCFGCSWADLWQWRQYVFTARKQCCCCCATAAALMQPHMQFSSA